MRSLAEAPSLTQRLQATGARRPGSLRATWSGRAVRRSIPTRAEVLVAQVDEHAIEDVVHKRAIVASTCVTSSARSRVPRQGIASSPSPCPRGRDSRRREGERPAIDRHVLRLVERELIDYGSVPNGAQWISAEVRLVVAVVADVTPFGIQFVVPGGPVGSGAVRFGGDQDRGSPVPSTPRLLDGVDTMVELNSSGVREPGPRWPPGRMEDVPDVIDELDVRTRTRLDVAIEFEDSHQLAADQAGLRDWLHHRSGTRDLAEARGVAFGSPNSPNCAPRPQGGDRPAVSRLRTYGGV